MVPLAEETGVQADVRKLPKRTDDIENGSQEGNEGASGDGYFPAVPSCSMVSARNILTIHSTRRSIKT